MYVIPAADDGELLAGYVMVGPSRSEETLILMIGRPNDGHLSMLYMSRGRMAELADRLKAASQDRP